jgi:hypothetical protein
MYLPVSVGEYGHAAGDAAKYPVQIFYVQLQTPLTPLLGRHVVGKDSHGVPAVPVQLPAVDVEIHVLQRRIGRRDAALAVFKLCNGAPGAGRVPTVYKVVAGASGIFGGAPELECLAVGVKQLAGGAVSDVYYRLRIVQEPGLFLGFQRGGGK